MSQVIRKEPILTPYERSRIALEQVGAVVGVMRLNPKACPSQYMALSMALEELEALSEQLEAAGS